MNESTVKGKWKEFKGEIQSQWGKLTSDDLEQTKGNIKSIIGLIEQKYGKAKDDISGKINHMAKRFEMTADEKVSSVSANAAQATQSAKETLRQ